MAQKLIINNDGDVERVVISDLSPPANVEIITAPEAKVVTVSASGPRGPRGEKGDKGDLGEGIFAQTGSYYSALGNVKISGSFEVSGSVVNFMNAGSILGSLFSGSFSGNGYNLTGIPTSSILDFNQNVAAAVFPYRGLAVITGSLSVLKNTGGSTDFFIIKSGSHTSLSVTNDGVVKIGEFESMPSQASAGGILYYNSEFWLGCE